MEKQEEALQLSEKPVTMDLSEDTKRSMANLKESMGSVSYTTIMAIVASNMHSKEALHRS